MRPLFWLRYMTRSLWRGGRRSVFALICIAVGVAGVVALETATLTVQTALTSNIRASNGGDISVVSQDAPIAPQDLRVLDTLQRSGRITGWTAIATLRATGVGPAGALVPFNVNVVSSPPYPLGGQPTFVGPSGGGVQNLLHGHGDVLITSVLADELGAKSGSRLTVNSIGGSGLTVTVRGILAETSFEHAAVLTVERRDLARLSTAPSHYTEIYANTPGDSTKVAAILGQHFPLARVQTVQQALNAAQVQVHDFRQFMLLVGLMALMIAGIGILNAMQSMLAWRRLEIAMLKAMGYPQPALFALFGGEAVLLGLAGGIAGTALGALGSKEIADALARALALQVDFQFDLGTLLGGISLGVGATLVFTVLPIVRAAGFRPLELLREGAGITTLRGVPQTFGLIALVLFLFAGLAAAIMGNAMLAAEFVGVTFAGATILTGGFAILVGWLGRIGPPRTLVIGFGVLLGLLALTAAAVIRVPALTALLLLATLVWGATVILSRRALLPLLMAARALSRRRTRTSVTLVAFLVGVLAMSLTLTVALSLQGQINTILKSTGSVNLVAVANTASEPAVLAASNSFSGVKNRTVVTVDSTTPVAVNGQPVSQIIGTAPINPQSDTEDRPAAPLTGLTGLDLSGGTLPDGIRVTSGQSLSSADAGTNHILVNRSLQFPPFGLTLGDRITLREAGTGSTRTGVVVGFYHRTGRRGFGSFFTGPILGDRGLASSLGGADAQSIISFNIDPTNLTHDATTLQHAVPGILVLNIGDLTRVVETILNELLNLLAVITALALGAGLAVVANGVALAMLERRREIALFKAIGFGPRQVMQFVLVENALAGTLAGAVSVLTVVLALSVLSRVALARAIGFDPLVATLVLIIASTLAVVTAYLAARGPIRIRPLEALRND